MAQRKIQKLYNIGIRGNLLTWFQNYLSNRQQRVVLHNTNSDWKPISAGVPQGSILGPLLFLIYINDIVNDISSAIRIFADDTCLFIEVDDRVRTANLLDADLSAIDAWAKQWIVAFPPAKTKSLIVSNKFDAHQNSPVHLMVSEIEEVKSHTYLGLIFS